MVDTSELVRLLQQARLELGCWTLSLRCDCKNLETVYVVERSGDLVVTDHRDALQYLDLSGDEVCAPVDIEVAGAICRRHGAELDAHDAELYPEIMQVVRDQSLREAIDAVAAAVDELFMNAIDDRPRS